MAVVLIATLSPRAGEYAAVLAALQAIVPEVHAEAGCELYALHESGDQLVLIEKWTSAAALSAHNDGPALRKLGLALDGRLLSRPDLRFMSAVAAGDLERGSV